MFNVSPHEPASFLLACAERFTPFGEMDIPREEYPGAPAFAAGLLEYAQQHDVRIQPLDLLRPDHGTVVPLLFANPDHDIPVVPLLVNYDRDPPPSPAEAWQLGTVLRNFIQTIRPVGERVSVIAAGGLSHWVGYEDASVNEAFDARFLKALQDRELGEWRSTLAEDIRREAGNGALEVMSWLVMAAVVPQAKAEIVYYQPMPSWMTGMGGVVMNLDSAA
jgi:aromatic ring-opening dioxygenase catalytic subunit (LigB family)